MSEYKILSAENPVELERLVSEALADGTAALAGGLQVAVVGGYRTFHQAVVGGAPSPVVTGTVGAREQLADFIKPGADAPTIVIGRDEAAKAKPGPADAVKVTLTAPSAVSGPPDLELEVPEPSRHADRKWGKVKK